MYTVLRRLHLFAGLTLLVFVLMYFASGYVMIHEQRFHRGEPARVTRTERLDYTGEPGSLALAEHLEERFGIRGKRSTPRRQGDGTWKFTWARPGTNHEVVVSATGDQVTLTRSTFGAVGIAHGLHRLHGYGGGGLYNVWAALYDLASLALILFALTGVLLWHRLVTPRWPGWIALGLGTGLTVAMILHLMLSR